MNRVGAPDRVSGCLAQPDVADLALRDQLGHRADGLLDRHVRIDAMLVVEVDVVRAESAERPLDRAAHVVGGAVLRSHSRHVTGDGVVHPPVELRRDHVLVAAPRDGPPDQQLVRQWPVQLRRIDEVDAELERPPDRLDALLLVGRAIKRRHPHTTQPDRRHLEITKLPPIHAPPVEQFARHPYHDPSCTPHQASPVTGPSRSRLLAGEGLPGISCSMRRVRA